MLDYKLGSSYLYHSYVFKYFYKSFHKQSVLVYGHYSSNQETDVKSKLGGAIYSNILSQNTQTYKDATYLLSMVYMLKHSDDDIFKCNLNAKPINAFTTVFLYNGGFVLR